jgi:hypothetical protein
MAKFLRLVNGIMKSFDESGTPTIYDKYLEVVASGAGANQINGPITAGTNITLPSAQTYTGDELQVFLNGLRLDNVLDYNHVSSTQISFLFNLEVTDVLRFYIDRGA